MDAVLLAREADQASVIEGRNFENTLILGPAIIYLGPTVLFSANTFEGNVDAMFLSLPNDDMLTGAIYVENVTFENCWFRHVGFAGDPETVDHLRETITPVEQTPLFPAGETPTHPQPPGLTQAPYFPHLGSET